MVGSALSRLTSPPTNAPIEPAPLADAAPTLPGWWRSDALLGPDAWQHLARAYGDGLRTPHLPVGGACGLQHYAGRFALTTLGVWVQTGHVLPMDHARWWLRLDERGHTIAVSAPGTGGVVKERSVAEVARAMLVDHLRPVVDAVSAATRITDRVAFGCIAAACAGAFGALHRRCGVADRARLSALAERFLRQPGWPAGAPLVRLAEWELDGGSALVHERHVCCLIRLGRDHGTCATCPDLGPAERAERLLAQAAAATQAADLPVSASVRQHAAN